MRACRPGAFGCRARSHDAYPHSVDRLIPARPARTSNEAFCPARVPGQLHLPMRPALPGLVPQTGPVVAVPLSLNRALQLDPGGRPGCDVVVSRIGMHSALPLDAGAVASRVRIGVELLQREIQP